MPEFNYESINLARPTFRLARLLAGSGDRISCEIFQAWFDQPEDIVPYEALSYTWGGEEMTDKIDVNGKELGVTLNLYLALQYLRFENQDRILWIDGLCINQKDHKEKGHQVQQMGNIYHRADHVIIWLGLATYETHVFMDSMKLLEQKCINFSRNNDSAWRDTWSKIQSELKNIHSDLKVRQCKGLESLFERPWFGRVWILQEVANARAAIIMCGVKSISARTFALGPSLLGVTTPFHCQSILDIMPGRSRQESWWSQKRDLQTLLLKFGRSAASDPRDNIYALLGLSSDVCEGGLLQADYSKPLREVMNDTAVFILHCPELQNTDFPYNLGMPRFLGSVSLLSTVALGWAQEEGDDHVAKALLSCEDIDVNWKNKDGLSRLSIAVQREHEQTVKLLLDRDDVDLNSLDKGRDTPLMRAVIARRTKMVKLLLARDGVKINWMNKEGQTPLTLAVNNRDAGTIEELLKRDDIDVNWKNKEGLSSLSIAVQGEHEQIVKLLLDRDDIDLNSLDKGGNSPLMKAVSARRIGMVRLLLARDGVKINWMNELGQTPLMLAVKNFKVEMIKELIECDDLDLNIGNTDGKTLLLIAVENKWEVVGKLLLARDDVDITLMDNNGQTPLRAAGKNPNTELARLLLAERVQEMPIKNKYGRTPQWLAARIYQTPEELRRFRDEERLGDEECTQGEDKLGSFPDLIVSK